MVTERTKEIVDYTKKMLKQMKFNNRIELMSYVANHFKIRPTTVNLHLSKAHFKSGFKRGGLDRYWKEVKEGKRKPPDFCNPLKAKEVLGLIKKRPRFSSELKKVCSCPSYFYHALLLSGVPIRKFKAVAHKKRTCIFFLPHQKIEAYKMLVKELGRRHLGYRRRDIMTALRINYGFDSSGRLMIIDEKNGSRIPC
jgi:hypothetical protein